MRNEAIVALLLAVGLPLVASAQERAYFKEDLLFYASYDASPNADFAIGDPSALDADAAEFVEGKFGRALLFEPEGAVRVCQYSAQDNILPDSGTVAFYFKPNWAGTDFTHRHLFFFPGASNAGSGVNAGDSFAVHTHRHDKPYQELWLWYDDHGGRNNIARTTIEHWREDEWVHVAATWDSSSICIYLDGELKAQRSVRGLITDPGEHFFVGAGRGGAKSSGGVIDELYVYRRPLSLKEIGLLTGKPELVKPRIHALEPLQHIFFRCETVLGFRCELCGRIEPERHRLRAELLGQPEGEPIAAMATEVTGATHWLEATAPGEGFCTLRVALTDEAGTVLDEKTAQLRFIDGPFPAAATALAE